MAGYTTNRNSNYTYNRSLETLRKRAEQNIQRKRMERLEKEKQAKSIRNMFDIFFNVEARKQIGGSNWFETTAKAFAVWFDRNYIEWFRNPVKGLLNNLSEIGSDLDYAANLIKAPLIAAAKGEDPGQRLADAYGLGKNGRIEQNMSELREALGAKNPAAEIGATAGFGALSGAEMGAKAGPLGALIGAGIGTVLGVVSSSIDVGVKESKTDNGFLKGTQTVCNTISDMIMEYGADPANLAGAIGDIAKFTNNAKQTAKVMKSADNVAANATAQTASTTAQTATAETTKKVNVIEQLANNKPASLDGFKEGLKPDATKAIKPEEVFDALGHRSSQLALQPVQKGKKTIIRTEEQQRKFVEKRIKDFTYAYMNKDKKGFRKALIESGIGSYMSDNKDELAKQVKKVYDVMRQDANMSMVGRFASFINKFDSNLAKYMYIGTPPGAIIKITSAGVMKGFKVRQERMMELAKAANNGEVLTPEMMTGTMVKKAAAQRYFKFFDKFDGLKGKYTIKDGMTQEELSDAYKSMTAHIALFSQRGYKREAKILQGLRRNIVLKNKSVEIRLGDADYAMRALAKNRLGILKLTDEEIETYNDTIYKLFYFEDGIDFFQDVMYDPSYFKGDYSVMTGTLEPLINHATNVIAKSADYKYKSMLDKISNTTFKWNAFNTSVADFYNNKLHEAVLSALEANKHTTLTQEEEQQFIKDIDNLLNQRVLDDDAIERINNYINGRYSTEFKKIMDAYSYKDIDNFAPIGMIDLADKYYDVSSDTIKEYQELYQQAQQGARLRKRFQSYALALENSDEISDAKPLLDKAKITSSAISDAQIKDINELESIRKNYTQILFNDVADEMAKYGTISKATKNRLADLFSGTLVNIEKELDDYDSYDIISTTGSALSAGSTKIANYINRSRIKKPKDIKNMTDEMWFLTEFKRKQQIAKTIYNNLHGNFRNINKAITDVRMYLANDDVFRTVLQEAGKYNDKSLYKEISNNIIRYIFGIDKDINESFINLFKHNVFKSINITDTEFLESIDAIKSLVNKDAQELYSTLTSSFNSSFTSTQGIYDNVLKVFDVLDFAIKDNNLNSGDFIDNFLQQRVFNNTLKEVMDAIGDTDPKSKKLYTQVLREMNIDGNTHRSISDVLNALYDKRKKMVDTILDIENNPQKYKDELINELRNKQTKMYERYIKEYNEYNNKLEDLRKSYKPVNASDYGFNIDDINYINKAEASKNGAFTEIKDYPSVWGEELGYNKKDVKKYVKAKEAADKQLAEINKAERKLTSIKDSYYKNFSIEAMQNKINEINNTPIEQLQLKYISQFKKETDEVYNKLTSLTRSMIMRNVNPNDFTYRHDTEVDKFINNIFKFTFTSKKDKKELIDGLVTRLNDIVLGYGNKPSDFEYARNFINMFRQGSFTNIRIHNGKFIFAFQLNNVVTDLEKNYYNIKPSVYGFEVSAEDFGRFFNNIVGVEKAYWVRNEIVKNSGLNKLDKTIVTTALDNNIITKQHSDFANFYESFFNNILTNQDYTISKDETIAFFNMLKGYNNMLDNIENTLTKNIEFAEEISPERVVSQAIRSGVVLENGAIKSTSSFFFDNTKTDNIKRQIKSGHDKLFDEPCVSTVTIKRGKAVREVVTMKDLQSGAYDDELLHLSKLNLVDCETNVVPENSQKTLLQTTIRTKDGARNFMVRNDALTNDYRYGNTELLDADYVNGNFKNVKGKEINTDDNRTLYRITNNKKATDYELYHTKEKAAIAMREAWMSNGAIDANGVLYITGHNASKFDADVILRFMQENDPNNIIKSVKVYDTMWLARMVMAAEYADTPNPAKWKFIDDESATLGNLYKHWVKDPNELLANAHNADADTEMNKAILDHIFKKIGNKPSEFFKKYFTEDINIDKNMQYKTSGVLKGIRTRLKVRDVYRALEQSLEKNKELHHTVSDAYAKRLHTRILNDAAELESQFKKIKTIREFEKFVDDFDSFYSKYSLYLDEAMYKFNDSTNYDIAINELNKLYSNTSDLSLDEIQTLIKEKYSKYIIDGSDMALANQLFTAHASGLDKIENIDQGLLQPYYRKIHNMSAYKFNDELLHYRENVSDIFEKKLSLLHGDASVQFFANREWTDSYLLDWYSNVMFNGEYNAFNDVMYMLSNASDAKALNKYSYENLTSIGYTVKGLLEQYGYDKNRLFMDYPLLKQFYGYTNRINAFIKFRNEMYTILYDIIKDAPDAEYRKYTEAFSGVIGELMGFGKGKNISVDGHLQELIRGCALDEKLDVNVLRPYLQENIENHLFKMLDSTRKNSNKDNFIRVFRPDDRSKIVNSIQNYINNCLDNLEEYSLGNSKRGFNSLTILRPTPDSKYINMSVAALGSNDPRGILGLYQNNINPIIAEKTKDAQLAREADLEDGLMNIAHKLRDGLVNINDINTELKYSRLPRAYVEQINNKTISQINRSMNVYSVKSVDNYTKEMNEIIEDRNTIYDAFNIHYDIKGMGPSEFRNVESKFYKTTEDIARVFGLDSYQMADLADIAALDCDDALTIKQEVFTKFFDELEFSEEEQELYERFRQQIINYKMNEIYNKPEEYAKLENSIKAYFAAAKLEKLDELGATVNAQTYEPLTKMQNMINHTTRYAQESNRLLNELFKDEQGNINYALMDMYIKSNPYMKVVAMIPSDRYNNIDKLTGKPQMASEFVVAKYKTPDMLRDLLNHDAKKDGIRYFVVDDHNLMSLKKMIGQSTSNKTYINRTIFKNHPHINRLMKFRDFIAKYMLLPTKVLGLQNLGFTTTNAIEGFLKTMVATEGNKFKTMARYKEAVQLHVKWSRATGKIAEAIKGGQFCLEKNQWEGMLKELENSGIIFGKDIDKLKAIWNKFTFKNKITIDDIKNLPLEEIEKLDMKEIMNMIPSLEDFRTALADKNEDGIKKLVYLTGYDKRELYKKYTKLYTKSEAEQKQAILVMLRRYLDTYDTSVDITKNFNKEQFDFITDFVNSPAAAAEMQSIKKANELNLIGNKQMYKNGKLVKEDVLSRFYKKALFSDWGIPGKYNPLKAVTPYFNLSLNSDIETINRLALHMDLLDKGFTHNEAYNRVLKTFFNYGDKPEIELLAEMFFPFISFPFRTALFWDEMLDENPQMIKIFADLVLTNWGKDAQNQYNQTGITKGGLKISPNLSVESGSSFLDSLVFGGNALNVLGTRKLNPLLGPLVEGAKQLVTGESNMNYRLSRLPIVSKVMYGMDLSKSLSKGNVALYDIAPSIFHKVYKDNVYYYNNQQQYQYRSAYSRLYTATGYNRWNVKSTKSRINAIKYLYGLK